MKNQGFVVLTAVIILSAALLILGQVLSRSGYFEGANTLDNEQKVQSYVLAHSCLDRALYNMSQDLDYNGGETLSIGGFACTIQTFTPSGDNTIIRTSASSGSATTKLVMVVDPYLAFVSFAEE